MFKPSFIDCTLMVLISQEGREWSRCLRRSNMEAAASNLTWVFLC